MSLRYKTTLKFSDFLRCVYVWVYVFVFRVAFDSGVGLSYRLSFI